MSPTQTSEPGQKGAPCLDRRNFQSVQSVSCRLGTGVTGTTSAQSQTHRGHGSLCSSTAWSVASKAEDESSNTRTTTCSLSIADSMSFCTRTSAAATLWLALCRQTARLREGYGQLYDREACHSLLSLNLTAVLSTLAYILKIIQGHENTDSGWFPI